MAAAMPSSISLPSPIRTSINDRSCLPISTSYGVRPSHNIRGFAFSTSARRYCAPIGKSAVGSAEFMVEPATNVKFQSTVSVPGCSAPLTLLGTGYREKVFAIIGVKVYAAGLYANHSVTEKLQGWKGKSVAEIEKDSSLFDAVYEDFYLS